MKIASNGEPKKVKIQRVKEKGNKSNASLSIMVW